MWFDYLVPKEPSICLRKALGLVNQQVGPCLSLPWVKRNLRLKTFAGRPPLIHHLKVMWCGCDSRHADFSQPALVPFKNQYYLLPSQCYLVNSNDLFLSLFYILYIWLSCIKRAVFSMFFLIKQFLLMADGASVLSTSSFSKERWWHLLSGSCMPVAVEATFYWFFLVTGDSLNLFTLMMSITLRLCPSTL